MRQFLVIAAVSFLAACGSGSGSESESVTKSPCQPAHPYCTTFSLTEDPISENNAWTNGGAVGLDWSNVQTTPGLAFGTQSGPAGPPFNDSIAILNGTWGNDQTVTATVHSINQQTGAIFEEVELLLRFQITAHIARGYEVNFRCTHDGSQYTQVVRWNGPLNNFTMLDQRVGPGIPGIKDGDSVKATIVGNVITVYINGNLIFKVTDNVFTSGNPGMGFYLQGAMNVNSDYGFTSFTASDGL